MHLLFAHVGTGLFLLIHPVVTEHVFGAHG